MSYLPKTIVARAWFTFEVSIVSIVLLYCAPVSMYASSPDQIIQKEEEIDQLNQKIIQLRALKQESKVEADAVAAQVALLEEELKKAAAEIDRTELLLSNIGKEEENTRQRIDELTSQIEAKHGNLREIIRMMHEYDNVSWITIFFDTWSLSEVLSQRATFLSLQEQMVTTIQEMKEQQEHLRNGQEELIQQQNDNEQLSTLLYSQQRELVQAKKGKDEFLKLKRDEQSAYEHRIAEAKQAREEIKKQIFRLRNTDVEVSLHDAFDMAKYAGSLTGVRPALLLAVLKVESNMGEWVGSGVFPDDMHPANRDAFLRITSKLGIDPNKATIGARPKSLKGWGGAIGPAQIMPNTWEQLEPRMLTLMKKDRVNPYDLTDAFVATAILLADSGGANPSQEFEAVCHYIAGPNWQYYTWYGERVMAVAKEYEAELNK